MHILPSAPLWSPAVARQSKILTAIKVAALNAPGRYADGGNLYLQVDAGNRKRWVVLARIGGKRAELGVGSARDVDLKQARKRAGELLVRIAAGEDPRVKAESIPAPDAVAGPVKPKTFREAAEAHIDAHEVGWKNAKHRQQWRNTLATYVYPAMGEKPVSEIATADVMAVLEPIWNAKPETAGRVRGRIETILDSAKARGERYGENPARLHGHIAAMLPKRSRLTRGHHTAMSYESVPAFVSRLNDREASAALALEFLILTAARTGEVLGAKWGEIDLAKAIWTVPAERMKAGRQHEVPLSPRALAILRKVQPSGDTIDPTALVFLAPRGGSLSGMAMSMLLRRMEVPVTVHGFRSSFRDWAAEMTHYAREVCEGALAHANPDKVEAAYRRSTLLEKRRAMMDDWATYCAEMHTFE